MIKLVVTNEKNLELTELEKVHVGENKFGYYLIFLPEVLNGYNLTDCEVKLIQVFEDDTSVAIDVDTTQETRPIKEFITLDATAQAQMVTLSVLITHNGNVIGKTNQKTYQVYPTKNATPIDPREELDEIIAGLRADKAELEETVSEQAETITSQGNQITELSGEVDELTIENAEQAATITRQNTTIDELNRRIPPLEILEPINPSQIQQTYIPESPNIGFPQVVVNPVMAEGVGFNKDYYKEGEPCLGKIGTYNPLPEGSVGGIYINEVNEYGYPSKILYYNLPKKVERINYYINDYFGDSSVFAKNSYKEIIFRNCPNLKYIREFQPYTYLEKLILPEGLIETPVSLINGCQLITELIIPNKVKIINQFMCYRADNIKTVFFPNSIETIIDGANIFGNCRKLEFVTLENGFNANGLSLAISTLYSVETIVSWLEALADRTGETAYTLTIGTTNLNKLTAEQKAIAINKNWNLN